MASVIINPYLTEKTNGLAAGSGPVYTFRIDPRATRMAVQAAVLETYKVKPRRVNIIRVKPKALSFKGKRGARPGFKKALVYLRPGDKIEFA